MQQRLGLRIVVTERVHCLQNSVAGVANLPNRGPGAHGMLLDDEATQLETPAGGMKEEEMRGILAHVVENRCPLNDNKPTQNTVRRAPQCLPSALLVLEATHSPLLPMP